MKKYKRILKIILYSFVGFISFLILLAFFTQTQYFRDRVRIILASSISTNINGTLHLGTIKGNFLTGFTMDSLAIYADESSFITTQKITCKYDLFPIFEKKFRIKHLTIERPNINFIRSSSKGWNIERLIKSDSTSSESTFDWTLQFDNIELKNASIRLADSVALSDSNHWNMPSSYFEYHNFSINDINLKLSAFFKKEELIAHIQHLSCYSPESQFELTHLKGKFEIIKNSLNASNIVIQTGKSYLELDASLKGINIFDGIKLTKLENDSTKLQLQAKNIDLRELRSFIPQISFLDGSANIDLDVNGIFGNLSLNKLKLKTFGSFINLSGSIYNLHEPSKLFLNIQTTQSNIIPSDIPKLLPGLSIPRLKNNEPINLSLEFIGEPTNFKTQTYLSDIKSSASIVGNMNLQQIPPTYNFGFATKKLDISKFLDVGDFYSLISSYGNITGKGFSIDKISSTLEITIDSSIIQDLTVNHSLISIIGKPNYLEGSINLSSNQSRANFQGKIDFSEKPLPSFDGKIELTSFDISKILRNEKYESNLNLNCDFIGSGNKFENLNTEINISLLPSQFQNHDLENDHIYLSLNQKDIKNKQLIVQSKIIDGKINGNFDLINSTSTIRNYITELLHAVIKHATIDSINETVKKEKLRTTFCSAPMDFQYHISLKNLEPIASLIEKLPFNVKANINGNIKNNGLLQFNCNGDISEFYIGTSKGGVLLNNTSLNLSVDSLFINNPLDSLLLKLNLSVTSGLINSKNMSDINLNVQYDHLSGNIFCEGIFDTTLSIKTKGEVSVQPSTYVFDLDSLILTFNDFTLVNNQDVQLRLNLEGLRIMHADFRNKNANISMAGALTHQGYLNLSASVKKFDLLDLENILGLKFPSLRSEGLSGLVHLDLNITGSTDVPEMKLHALGENIFIRNTKVGQFFADFDYKDQVGSINIELKENPKDPKPQLAIFGTLPINLAFSKVEQIFPDKPQSINIKSDGINIGILDPLLKDFNNISGILRSDIKITGTPTLPTYEGFLTLEETKFLFTPNNIDYVINCNLEAFGDKINIKSFSIKNLPVKGIIGESNINGFFTIKNYKIDNFDLTAKGKFLLMTEATRKTSPSMYGTLLTETDSEGLNLKGTLNRPYISGKLFIKEANLTFPPTRTAQLVNSSLSLPYRVLDDTSKNLLDKKISKYYSEGDETSDTTQNRTFESPIIDRLRYNILVETQGPTNLNMIFTPTTGEELYTELEGKVSVVNEQGTAAIYGEIDVSPHSYYNFFKRFDANGKLKFIGQWDNPELDIQAKYEGYKTETSQQLSEQKTPTLATTDEAQIKEKKVIVELKITGTRYEPKLTMGMKIQNKPGEEPIDYSTLAKGGDIQSDAISFIITGKFRDELTSREQQEFTDLGTSTGSSMASSLLSSIFSDVLKKEFPFIKRADVTYRGGSVQEGTSVDVTATAFKGYLRVGGKIFQDIGNANVSYQLSLGDFFNSVSIRNLFFEIQRKVEGDNPEDKKLTNEARFYYKFSF